MTQPVDLAEVWRGDMVESRHMGHAVVVDAAGRIVHSWGDPDAVIYPRSSTKMIQALPLIETGAAAAYDVSTEELALACASHRATPAHTSRVAAWLDRIGCTDDDLRCGVDMAHDTKTRKAMVLAGETPRQIHNCCSGKHAGFLTVNKHIGGGSEYDLIDHPLQKMIKADFEALTGETSPRFAVDGCSVPTHACSLLGFARAMARFAAAGGQSDPRSQAMAQLVQAMITHPVMIANDGRADTDLMRACTAPVALKGGAEAMHIAILPDHGLGVALKVVDGEYRGSECAIAAILVKLKVLDPDHPATQRYRTPIQRNLRQIEVGQIRPAPALQ